MYLTVFFSCDALANPNRHSSLHPTLKEQSSLTGIATGTASNVCSEPLVYNDLRALEQSDKDTPSTNTKQASVISPPGKSAKSRVAVVRY